MMLFEKTTLLDQKTLWQSVVSTWKASFLRGKRRFKATLFQKRRSLTITSILELNL
jgi:hypothetical protein